MGKSNNLYNKIKIVNERKNHLNKFLKKHEIKVLKDINSFFIDQFIKFFTTFIKSSVKLISCNMRIGSYNSDEKIIHNLRCLNLIEISPYKNQSFVIFPYDFLSVVIDILFGGGGSFTNKNKKITDVTFTEFLINKKIIEFITNSFTDIYRKNFSPEINFINIKTFFDLKKSNLDFNTVFLINSLIFNINNIEVFFDISIPISTIKDIYKKISFLESDNDTNTSTEKNIKHRFSFNDIYDVKLNIISKITDISIAYDKIYNLSLGDVLLIEKPNKIMGFIEDQAAFFGNYKRFNEQSIVFIEEFIDSNVKSNQDKESLNE